MERKSTTKARREREKLIRKRHILDCAEAVMEREGIFGLSMDAVAKEAELAKGTLYLYFKNKEEIIAQLSTKARQFLLKAFHEATASQNDPLQKLEALLWSVIRFKQQHPLYNELVSLFEGHRNHPEDGELLQSSMNITAFVVSIVDQAKNQGHFRPDLNATEFSYLLWGATIGILQLIESRQQVITDHLQQDTEHLFAHYIQIILRGAQK